MKGILRAKKRDPRELDRWGGKPVAERWSGHSYSGQERKQITYPRTHSLPYADIAHSSVQAFIRDEASLAYSLSAARAKVRPCNEPCMVSSLCQTASSREIPGLNFIGWNSFDIVEICTKPTK